MIRSLTLGLISGRGKNAVRWVDLEAQECSYGSFQVIKEDRPKGSLLNSMQVARERICVSHRCFIGIGEGRGCRNQKCFSGRV